MKIYKAVAYSSLAILVLTAILVASLPLRFPDSSIAWKPMMVFSIPVIALVALLFIKPVLTLKVFRIILAMAAVLSIASTFAGWMASVILCISLAALGVLFIQGEWQERR